MAVRHFLGFYFQQQHRHENPWFLITKEKLFSLVTGGPGLMAQAINPILGSQR